MLITQSELKSSIEKYYERMESIRAAIELAGIPLDDITAKALDDLKVEINRVTNQDERE